MHCASTDEWGKFAPWEICHSSGVREPIEAFPEVVTFHSKKTGMNLRKTDQYLVLGYFAFAVAYLATLHLVPYPLDFLVKATPALLMAVMVALQVKGWTGKFLFAAGGDVSLAFVPRGKEMAFVVGLGLFLLAHVLYILSFTRKMKYQPHRLPLMIAIVAFAVAMVALLLTRKPGMGELTVPVMVYVTVITLMGLAACLRDEAVGGLMVGALLFIVSDACIALNKFVIPESMGLGQYASYAIMSTYYLGQYFIGRSFIPYQRA
jgi:alkenylglycerophosphocholine/alkenylglycerophosphoethanolamine hydrolase